MRFAKWILLAAGVSLGTTACGIATTVGADYDPTLDLGRYPTFAWDESAIIRTDDVRLENNPFFEERLFEAVEQALSEKEISYNESSPDLLVHYHLSVRDHIEVVATDPQFGDPPSEYGEGTEVLQYDQGTFVLHFVDAATDEDLWVGWAQGDIGAALKDSMKMREWVEDAVTKMLKDFPVQTIPTGTRG
jgi:hypothetical protein